MRTYKIIIKTEVQAENEEIARIIAFENNIACGKFEIEIEEIEE